MGHAIHFRWREGVTAGLNCSFFIHQCHGAGSGHRAEAPDGAVGAEAPESDLSVKEPLPRNRSHGGEGQPVVSTFFQRPIPVLGFHVDLCRGVCMLMLMSRAGVHDCVVGFSDSLKDVLKCMR